MPKTSKAPICDKAAFDAYPYHVNGRAITAKVVMFSVAEKLELELAELRQQVEKMRNCDNCKHLGASLWEDDGDPCGSCPKSEKWEARK